MAHIKENQGKWIKPQLIRLQDDSVNASKPNSKNENPGKDGAGTGPS